jgi:hypothetical protein
MLKSTQKTNQDVAGSVFLQNYPRTVTLYGVHAGKQQESLQL